MDLKPDADEIADIVDQLAQASWLDSSRSSWPKYLFHVTDVRNVVPILSSAVLLSRNQAEASGLMVTDNGSSEIIDQTGGVILDHVRLYFRPRTPTFYHNEGIRPTSQRSMSSHCPIPVALLLDSKSILGMSGSRFSDGSLARSRTQTGDSAAFLRRLPFEQILHDRAFPPEAKDEIIFRRQAEVIVPDQLALDDILRHVFVRSVAEFETLHSLLRTSGATIPFDRANRIRVNSHVPLFFKQWSFVERTSVVNGLMSIEFNPSTQTPGPFVAEFELENPDTGQRFFASQQQQFVATGVKRYQLPDSWLTRPFRFRLSLDGCLAYQNEFDPTRDDALIDVPF